MSGTTYRKYVLAVLTLVYALNFIDRNLVILLLEPIKEDLHLTDTKLGLLTGIAFGLFYATLGLSFSRWADRGNRVTITSIALGLWGLTLMAYIFITGFGELILARIASAVGEAGCMPPTYSLLGDYFPKPAERVRAMSVYLVASPISALASFFLGAWLNEHYGWRTTFFAMGVPGLALAVVVKLTVIEPRVRLGYVRDSEQQWRGLARVLKILWQQRSSRHLNLAIILLYLLSAGLGPWYAAFLMRTHAMSTIEVGIWLGSIFGICGAIGILLGGYVGGRFFAHDERSQLRMSAATLVLAVPCFMLFLLLPSKQAALFALMLFTVMVTICAGPAYALMQRLVADEIRSRALAVMMLLANLIGMGVGPLAVGVLSDVLKPRLGTDSLRYAMLAMSLVAFWVAYHLIRVGRTVAKDLAAVTNPTELEARRSQSLAADPLVAGAK
jgi:MFS family permease